MSVPCPDCGHYFVSVTNTCHTYRTTDDNGNVKWWSCVNCDSAYEYSCNCWLNDEVVNPDDPHGMLMYQKPECNCQWSYVDGLNPDNPRFEKMQESRPDWLEQSPHPDVDWW